MSKQILNVLVHENKKLFHISIHNVDSHNVGASIMASKARWSYDRICASGPRSIAAEKSLYAGLIIAMVNTGYTGWSDNIDTYPRSKKEALIRKDELISEWENKGYTNVGVRTIKNVDTGYLSKYMNNWSKKFNIVNMTKEKIDTKINIICRSMDNDISQTIRNNAYYIAVGMKTHTFKIDNMAMLFRYIREEVANVIQKAA